MARDCCHLYHIVEQLKDVTDPVLCLRGGAGVCHNEIAAAITALCHLQFCLCVCARACVSRVCVVREVPVAGHVIIGLKVAPLVSHVQATVQPTAIPAAATAPPHRTA